MEKGKIIAELMNELPLFGGLEPEEWSVLERCFTVKTYQKDEIVLPGDMIGHELFIVGRGTVLSNMNVPGAPEQRHREFGAGDFFGELCIFGGKPSFNTYRAAGSTVVMSISERDMNDLIENHPMAGIKFMSKLVGESVRNLRLSSRFLADVVQWGENASRRVITDELTGIYNREFLDDAMESFFNISCNNCKSLSLFMVDVDNLRTVNDELGIKAGNEIIRRVVDIFKSNISRYGIIARYGGDEFSILLPEANLKKATDIAENMRREVESRNFSEILKGSGIRVTVSIGISSFPETATDFESFKEKADSSLYRAKHEGRNRVVSLA